MKKFNSLTQLHDAMLSDPVYRNERAIEEYAKRCEEHNARMQEIDKLTADISLDRLRELVAAERDGQVVVLPCKAGSDVYRVVNDAEPHVTKDTVRQISINVHGQFLVLTGDRLLYLSDFGKTVFLTRAEAEQALVRAEAEAKGEQE